MNATINTGALLKTYIDLKRIRRAALARILGKSLKSVMDYEKKDSIQTRTLWEICAVLKHNFFMDIALQLPKEFTCGTDIFEEKNQQIAALEKEVEQLKRDKEMLIEIIKK